jgi:hypothetical protein
MNKQYGAIIIIFSSISFAYGSDIYNDTIDSHPISDIIIDVTTDISTAKSFQPVILDVTVENQSDHDLFYLDSLFILNYQFTVIDKNLSPVQLTSRGKQIINNSDFIRHKFSVLHPKHQIHNRIVINGLFDMTVVGDYTITLSRTFNEIEKQGRLFASNPIRVSIQDGDFYDIGKDRITNASGEVIPAEEYVPDSIKEGFFQVGKK